MAFDGGFLSVIKREIASQAEGCRVDKIYQPSRDELVLQLSAQLERAAPWSERKPPIYVSEI